MARIKNKMRKNEKIQFVAVILVIVIGLMHTIFLGTNTRLFYWHFFREIAVSFLSVCFMIYFIIQYFEDKKDSIKYLILAEIFFIILFVHLLKMALKLGGSGILC